MPIVSQLATMHCTNHVKRGPADAVWGAAVLDFRHEGGQAQYISFWGRRGSGFQWKPAPPTTLQRATASWRAFVTMKHAEGYNDIDWRDSYYGLRDAVQSLNWRPMEEIARPVRPPCPECGQRRRYGHLEWCSHYSADSTRTPRRGRGRTRMTGIVAPDPQPSDASILEPDDERELDESLDPQAGVTTRCEQCGATDGHWAWCSQAIQHDGWSHRDSTQARMVCTVCTPAPTEPEIICVLEPAPESRPAPVFDDNEDAPVLRRPRKVDF